MTEKTIVGGLRLGAAKPKKFINQPTLDHVKTLFLEPPPASLLREHINPMPQMLGNDVYGDCTSVGIGNALNAIAALSGFHISVTRDDALRFYGQSTGWNPNDPSTDMGGIEAEVLAYAAKKGYETKSGVFYPLWGTLENFTDRRALANVIARFGVAYIGIELAQVDQLAAADPDISYFGDVSDPTYSNYNPTPGSWGGHCALLWGYTGLGDSDFVFVLTWGKIYKATWAWLKSRMMEAHALAFRQLIKPDYTYMDSHEDWDKFIQDNQKFLDTPLTLAA